MKKSDDKETTGDKYESDDQEHSMDEHYYDYKEDSSNEKVSDDEKKKTFHGKPDNDLSPLYFSSEIDTSAFVSSDTKTTDEYEFRYCRKVTFDNITAK